MATRNSSISFPIKPPGTNTAKHSRRRLPDMAKQAINWTALPNGYSDDGKSLRISLLVSPRLEPDSDESLKPFPDFVDWPANLAQSHFVLTYGAGPPVKIPRAARKRRTRLDNRRGTAESTGWRA